MALMQRGSRLHHEGDLPQALIAFEEALQALPGNLDACSATATMLSLLGRPAAAYRLLLEVETGLMATADGAANLAIAAESCGDMPKAYSAYEQALQIDPGNLRALTNVGLISASLSQWDMAIACARKCVAMQPADLNHRQTLSDVLTSARRYPEALSVLQEAGKAFPGYLDITIRHITVLAFSGDLEGATTLETGLDGAGKAHLREFLAQSLQRSATSSFELLPPGSPFSALQLFAVQAYAAMAECDWRNNSRLSELTRDVLIHGRPQDFSTLGKDCQLYALTLDLNDAELVQLNSASFAAAVNNRDTPLPAFVPGARKRTSPKDERLRVGFAIHQLQQLPALRQQLSCCDRSSFLFHVYSFATPSEPYDEDALRPLPITLVEMAHMTDAEAVGRIRLDALDIYVDTTPEARWYRPQLTGARVANVQLGQHNWFSGLPACWDYTMSDTFVHPENTEPPSHGAVVRLPATCWLETHAEQPAAAVPARESLGLPPYGFVLCSQAMPVSLDSFSFLQWMDILRVLPEAVLWLPACNAKAAVHLVREAETYGVQAQRLVFSPPMPAADMLASLVHADLVLDTLRVNQPQEIEDALRLGIPAITCTGTGMASRIGGSILRAAGLAELVTDSPAEYVKKIVELAHKPEALQGLKRRITAARTSSHPFDLASRLKGWQSAWTIMAQRSRMGRAPASFDVPSPPDGSHGASG
ncbi:MAG: hypothetical protein V4718_17850 [Pseudomonadota bacterium]